MKGKEPPHKKQVWRFLKQLDERPRTGLPTWQVTPYNPHAITNFIETQDGTYRIIDLESTLVAFLYPVSAILRLIRAGIFPSFDDIDVNRLRAYVVGNSSRIQASLDDGYAQLVEAITLYETTAEEWHASEPPAATCLASCAPRCDTRTPRRWLH